MATTNDKITVGIWEKRPEFALWGQVGEVETWNDITLQPRFNKPGPWSCSVPWGTQAAAFAKTRLVTFDFRGFRVTAVVENFGASTDETGQPLLDVSGVEALTLIGDALGWPTPARDLDEQTEVRYYVTGVAETVLRNFIKANVVDRLGYEMTLPASRGRGDEITINSLFDNVLAVVTDKATLSGLRVRTGLVNTTSSTRAELRTWFETPADRSREVGLAHKAGTLRRWKQNDAAPTATRVLVQAAKELEGREVASVNVTANTITTVGKERTWNREVESVSVANNTITTKSSHDLARGDRIRITGGTAPAPLVKGTDYFAIRVDKDTLRVAATRTAAKNGNAINLTDNGAGQVVVTKVRISGVDNKLRTGDVITFTGGTPPAPLEVGTPYHAVQVDKDTFKVAMTRADARSGDVIGLTSAGAGKITVTEETFRYRDVRSTPAETEWGRARETLLTGNGEDNNVALDEQGQQALDDAKAQSAFELETVEADGRRPLIDFVPGDLVTVDLLTGVSKVVEVGAFNITTAPDPGITLQTIPGDPDAANPLFAQARIIRALRRQATRAQED